MLFAYLVLAALVPGGVANLAGALALMALFWGWRGLKQLSQEERLVLVGMLIYVLAAMPSLVNNSDWATAGWRFEKYHPFLLAIPMLGAIVRLDRAAMPTALAALAIAGIAMGAYVGYRYGALREERVGFGTGLNPNIFGHLASYTALVLLLSLAVLRQRVGWILLLFAAFLGAMTALIASGSRGVLVAFLGGAVVAILALHGEGFRSARRKRWVLAAVAGVFVLVAILMAYSDFWAAHWKRLFDELRMFREGDFHYTSVAARMTLLLGGWEIWLTHPWLGTGLGDGQRDLDALIAAGQLPPVPGASYAIFHNAYLDVLATTGLLGFAGMLVGVFALPMRCFWRALRQSRRGSHQQLAAAAGLAVITDNIIFAFSNSWLHLRGLPFALILLLVLVAAARQRGSGADIPAAINRSS